MDFIITLSSVVNAAGGFLFLLAGVLSLLLAGRHRRGRSIGAFATAFGATYVFQNLILARGDLASVLLAVCFGATTLIQAWLVWELSRALPVTAKRRVALVALAAGVLWAASLALAFLRPDLISGMASRPTSTIFAGMMLQAQQLAMIPVIAAAGYGMRHAPDADGEAALACFVLAIGPIGMFLILGPNSPGLGADYLVFGPARFWIGLAFLAWSVLYIGAAATTRFRQAGARTGLARWTFAILMAAGLVGPIARLIMAPSFTSDGGSYGIIRTVGVVFLALGVLRYDLLGARLRGLAAKGGLVATVALCVLFIVAQVLQNFLSTEYGLLLGGVLAGVLLFAASPVQRAMERRTGATKNAAAGEADRAFRNAVELAFRDRLFDDREELVLAELADRLGLTARRATEIRLSVEREHGVR
jgi:hypothetical protein